MLAALLGRDDEAAGKGRRKRRKNRHKHGKGRDKGKRKKGRCKPHAKTRTCEGRCGAVKNNCKNSVDCGACACACAAECASAGLGDLCCSGSCFSGECRDNSACSGTTAVCSADHICVACESAAECGDGFLCLDDGACQPRDVTCPGAVCVGTELQTELSGGGMVYVCPGCYTGAFSLTENVTVVGAGDGDDSGVDTILDALGSGTVVTTGSGDAVTLRSLRVTGGGGANLQAAGIISRGSLTLESCTVSGNVGTSNSGSAIAHRCRGDACTFPARWSVWPHWSSHCRACIRRSGGDRRGPAIPDEPRR